MEIKVHDVTFSYENTMVLKDIMLVAKEKEITTILGKSGSGKTTLLELMDALILPQKGFIMIGSYKTDAKKWNYFNTVRSHIGYLFQYTQEQLFCKTVKKELIFAYTACHPKKNIDKEMKEILLLLNLSESYLQRDPMTLNRIEQKKIVIACLLLKDPEILLLDEPFMGLTAKSKKEMVKLILTLKKEYKKTIFVATQDTDMALKISDFIYIIWNKKIRLLGTKYSVLKEEKLLIRYGIKVPDIIKFSNIVMREKHIKMGYRDDINDLIKDVYRYVK